VLLVSIRHYGLPLAQKKISFTTVLGGENLTAGVVGVSSMAAAAPVVDTLVHCELLYFLNGTVDNHPSAAIKSTISGFYRDDEILNVRNLLE